MLAGWDLPGAQVVDLATWRAARDRPRQDLSALAVGLGTGLLLGSLLSRRRRVAGGLLGALGAGVVVAAQRRLWELPETAVR